MKTPTTKKLISVTVASADTRNLPNENMANGMVFPDEKFYGCQAHALGTWISTEMVAKGRGEERHSAGLPHPS